ncbi:MAG TPA: hypothetical protein VNX68_17875 [Nitrosopumilaceae archaeon]|nr:hypothetical protein [Nitrosopumilaceae archaeon]
MATNSNRTHTITYSGDINAVLVQSAVVNANSPGETQIMSLAIGANVITPPGGGTVPTAVTIQPNPAFVTSITLKGVAGDTGIPLHKTDPTTIALDPSFVSLVLVNNSAGIIPGVRLTWT